MKKIITLFIALGAVIAVQAQSPKDEARRVILGGGQKADKKSDKSGQSGRDVILGGGNTETSGSREAQIDQVNREYNSKIESIRNNPTLSQEEKDRAIRQLERDRQRKIEQINRRYEGSDDDGNDNDGNKKNKNKNKKAKKNKSNNGKHLGWEKGKGNPHRTDGADWKNKRDRDDD
ncbi:MAG TPA: DUF1542 domain-containing protein [Flavisolibacter sp.]